MAITTVDKNRRAPIVTRENTTDVLPEWFLEENSKLIDLLNVYGEFVDSDAGNFNFHQKVQDVFAARDLTAADEDFLDELIAEIGNGLKASSFFAQPRLMARLLGRFYQAKGTRNAAEGFFRGFFNEEAEIIYPKKDIFIVAESEIGFDSQKRIIDNRRYQVLSILIRSGLSVSDYENLYKKFVHPAGFHFAGDVVSVGTATLTPTLTTHDPLEEPEIASIYLSEASPTLGTLFGETTLLYDSSDGSQFRVDTIQQELVYYTVDSDLTAGLWTTYYDDIKTLLSPNSFTFDDSATSGRPDFAMTVETMDNDYFTRISSDSAI